MQQLECPHCRSVIQSSADEGVTLLCGVCQNQFIMPARTVYLPQENNAYEFSSRHQSSSTGPAKATMRPQLAQAGKVLATAFAFITGATITFVGLGKLRSGSHDPAKDPYRVKQQKVLDHREVWFDARELVRRNLENPSTANFGGQTSAGAVSETFEGRLVVRGWVESQNESGTRVRSDFVASYLRTPAGFQLEDIQMTNR